MSKTTKKSSASSRRARRHVASTGATSRKIDVVRQVTALATMRDAAIDTTDIPEILDCSEAVRGRFYRPVKQVITIRLDADVVAWFKSHDRNYQTAVNRVLRE